MAPHRIFVYSKLVAVLCVRFLIISFNLNYFIFYDNVIINLIVN